MTRLCAGLPRNHSPIPASDRLSLLKSVNTAYGAYISSYLMSVICLSSCVIQLGHVDETPCLVPRSGSKSVVLNFQSRAYVFIICTGSALPLFIWVHIVSEFNAPTNLENLSHLHFIVIQVFRISFNFYCGSSPIFFMFVQRSWTALKLIPRGVFNKKTEFS